MIFEVTGVSTRNKGAELMLLAIQQHYRHAHRDVALAVDPWFGTWDDRIRYGLRSKLVAHRFGRASLAAMLMTPSFRNAYGLVTEEDIDAVIDASGFAFGDQLGAKRSEDFARDVERWKRQGKKVVLLPQALGPFQNPQIRQSVASVLAQADLVYARDRESLAHCEALGAARGNLRLAPDFTSLVEVADVADLQLPQQLACIVPNDRILEKLTAEESARYLPALATCVAALRARGFEPCILLHDVGVDEGLVEPLQRSVPQPLPVLRAADPRRLKGILGQAKVVIGSRFHALIGALAQAVPCLGIGWSHKYQMLFEDYDCPDCLIPVAADDARLQQAVRTVADEPDRGALVARLQLASAGHQARTRQMWLEVDRVLGLASPEAAAPAR